MRSRFGACTLDTSTRELIREGRAIHITGKAFRLLEILVENRSRAMSKEELQSAVWPGIFVSDGNLSTLVAELRKAIGDDAHGSRFIRTVYGFGYAFSGTVEDDDAGPAARPGGRCRLVWGRKEIALGEGENILGRGPESLEWIDRDTVSRRHARIVVEGGAATLEDLGSKNGTSLGGKPVAGVAALADGDEIRLGSVPLTFRVLGDTGSTATGLTRERGRG